MHVNHICDIFMYYTSVEENFDHHVYSSVNKAKKVSAKSATDEVDDTLNISECSKQNTTSEIVNICMTMR